MPNKPNQNSREWNRQGFKNEGGGENPVSHVRRCGRCESFAAVRIAKGLQPLSIPPHHEDEHYDNAVRTFRSGSEREAYTGIPECGQRVRPYVQAE